MAAQVGSTKGCPVSTPIDSFSTVPSRIVGELKDRKAQSARALNYHVSFLDDCLRAILPNDLVLIGAPSGIGKTDLALNIAASNASKGRAVHYFALEAEPLELERRTKFAMLSRLCYQRSHPQRNEMVYVDWLLGNCEHICGAYNDEVDHEILAHLGQLWTYYRGAKFDAKDLQNSILKVQSMTDLIVVDHLHYIDTDGDDHEASALGDVVKTLRDVALRIGKPVILVAHLRKRDRGAKQLVATLDDFHGSSNIVKICTQAITIERASCIDSAKWYLAPTFMTVLKDRRGGAPNLVALMHFDRRTKGYNDSYTLGKLSRNGTEWEQLSPGDKPGWAHHHKTMEVA